MESIWISRSSTKLYGKDNCDGKGAHGRTWEKAGLLVRDNVAQFCFAKVDVIFDDTWSGVHTAQTARNNAIFYAPITSAARDKVQVAISNFTFSNIAQRERREIDRCSLTPRARTRKLPSPDDGRGRRQIKKYSAIAVAITRGRIFFPKEKRKRNRFFTRISLRPGGNSFLTSAENKVPLSSSLSSSFHLHDECTSRLWALSWRRGDVPPLFWFCEYDLYHSFIAAQVAPVFLTMLYDVVIISLL